VNATHIACGYRGAPPSRRLARRRPAAVESEDALAPAGEDAGAPFWRVRNLNDIVWITGFGK